AAGSEEVVLVVEAWAPRNLRRTRVDPELRALRIDVEDVSASLRGIALNGDLRGGEAVVVAGISVVDGQVNARLRVELDQHRGVRNVDEAPVLRVEGECADAGGGLLLILHRAAVLHFRGLAGDLLG